MIQGFQVSYYRSAQPAQPGTPQRIGILLVNLGTPAQAAIVPVMRYLREFLSDRRVIEAAPVLWRPLLYGLILPLRSWRTLHKYRQVWMPEGSPLAVWSGRLSARLAASPGLVHGDRLRVELAMTYGEPRLDDALTRLMAANVSRLLVLPLYPQYSGTTSGAAFDRVCRSLRRWRYVPQVRFVNQYWSHPAYIRAIAGSVQEAWAQAGRRSHLLISFHGIPQQYVDRGDPYREHAEGTAALVRGELGIPETDMTLAYQSRFGPARWLQPGVEESLGRLAASGIREITVVAPSFAVDCLETLEEIGMRYREAFARLGGQLHLVPALNDGDAHLEVLRGVIVEHLQDWL